MHYLVYFLHTDVHCDRIDDMDLLFMFLDHASNPDEFYPIAFYDTSVETAYIFGDDNENRTYISQFFSPWYWINVPIRDARKIIAKT